ncbi:endonuclease III [Oscillibacter sp. MSJ-2]|uniref:Endonuclease III n=1 Tax=Dysosmobacter acutus TaxID=2841504 RepID=A0ABS6FBX5_9FIRM|nr:endonuclease III [Dysosmobacter acutus]
MAIVPGSIHISAELPPPGNSTNEVIALRASVKRIIEELKVLYPDALCSLDYQKDYELLFSVRLAAQCTDARVNLVTPALFARFPTLESFAEADPAEVGEYIRSCGFFNTKSRDLVECAKVLVDKFGGKVPGTMEELTSLPGIGRKTANLILGDIYHQPAYVCDTHCIRITGRLGLTDGSKDPLSVERQLRVCLPPEESSDFCHRMVLHGRAVCTARSPKCESCTLRRDCAYAKAKK